MHCEIRCMKGPRGSVIARSAPHYCDAIMGEMVSQITSLTAVYSAVHTGADQRKHQNSALLAFVLGIHRSPVNSPHKWPVTRKMFPFDNVIIPRALTYPRGPWVHSMHCGAPWVTHSPNLGKIKRITADIYVENIPFDRFTRYLCTGE